MSEDNPIPPASPHISGPVSSGETPVIDPALPLVQEISSSAGSKEASQSDFRSEPLALPCPRLAIPSLVATSDARAAFTTLAGQIAHQVNNSLTIVIGNASMLKSDLEEGSLEWECASAILHPAKRIRDMVEGLLSFASQKIGAMSEFDVSRVAESWYDALMLRSPRFNELIGRCPQYQDLQLFKIPIDGAYTISANPCSIECVIESLVSNALEADPSGRVTLGVQPVEIGEKFPLVGKMGVDYGRYVRLFVEDRGYGMDGKTVSRACDPGFTTKGPSRMGLGLSAAYGLVRQMNGFLTIASEPGIGTRVEAYIPHLRFSDVSCHEATPISIRAPTILIVDDDKDLLGLVETILQGGSYEVLTADDGKKAVEVSKGYTGNIDLLLTDVMMPGVNGHEAADAIRLQRPSMKVLYMSGYPNDERLRRYIAEGDPFLQKPFGQEEILAKVKEVLG